MSLWTTFWGLKPVPEELGFLGPSSCPFMDSGSPGLALVCSELSPGVAGPRWCCVGPRLPVLQAVPGSSFASRAALICERLAACILPSVVALAPARWEAAPDPTPWSSCDVGLGHHLESLQAVPCFGLLLVACFAPSSAR